MHSYVPCKGIIMMYPITNMDQCFKFYSLAHTHPHTHTHTHTHTHMCIQYIFTLDKKMMFRFRDATEAKSFVEFIREKLEATKTRRQTPQSRQPPLPPPGRYSSNPPSPPSSDQCTTNLHGLCCNVHVHAYRCSVKFSIVFNVIRKQQSKFMCVYYTT